MSNQSKEYEDLEWEDKVRVLVEEAVGYPQRQGAIIYVIQQLFKDELKKQFETFKKKNLKVNVKDAIHELRRQDIVYFQYQPSYDKLFQIIMENIEING